MTFNDFHQRFFTEILPKKPFHIRKGQALMNYLSDIWKNEYIRISSLHFYDRTDIDCFFRDDLVNNTLEHLSSVWDENKVIKNL